MLKRPVQLDEKGYRKFGMRDKLAYAAGDFGCNMSAALKYTVQTFWLAYMMMETGLFFILMLLMQVWDAVNDPIIGAKIDRNHKRYRRGKFKRYILLGALGLGISGAAVFLPFHQLDVLAKAALFILAYMAWDTCYTFVNVPYGSMLNLVSDGDAERVQLSVWRTIGAVVGNLIPIVVLPLVMCKKVIYDGSGTIPGMEGVFHNKPAAMGGAAYEIGDVMLSPLTGEKVQVLLGARAFWVILLLGVIGFIAITFMIKNLTLRADEHSFAGDNGAEKSNLLKGCGRFLKNRPAFGASVAAMGVLLCMYAATTANAILFATYFGMAQWSGVVQAIAFLPMILFMPFVTKIVQKFGKKEASSVGTIVSMIGGAVMLIFPLVGKDAGFVVYLLGLVIFGLGMGVYLCVSWAMVADAIDYHEWKFGLREEGTVYALHSFFRKVAQSAGPVLVLLLMGALGYASELGTIGQNGQTAANMTWLVAGLYMLSAVFQFVGVALIYNLDKKTLEQMRADLAVSRRR